MKIGRAHRPRLCQVHPAGRPCLLCLKNADIYVITQVQIIG